MLVRDKIGAYLMMSEESDELILISSFLFPDRNLPFSVGEEVQFSGAFEVSSAGTLAMTSLDRAEIISEGNEDRRPSD